MDGCSKDGMGVGGVALVVDDMYMDMGTVGLDGVVVDDDAMCVGSVAVSRMSVDNDNGFTEAR